ncbi:MAG: efflux RND transporter permease subunit [Alphaproteobacteria bacterium]|nr:efflux RND transporter permease subunit [Alphaproteobacteria bacterium]
MSWTGLSLQEVETAGLAFILMGLAFVFGYLFLVALYESWLVAFSVIFSNIFAVLGALIGLKLLGLSLSIYAQLGIVLLIGLASKNAILIVEFILDAQQRGESVLTAAVSGATERFRAVLMTAFTFILGVMPMVFDTGAGAASQNSMGTTVFFGMIFATTIGILFIPALFVIFDSIGYKKNNAKHPIKQKKRVIK